MALRLTTAAAPKTAAAAAPSAPTLARSAASPPATSTATARCSRRSPRSRTPHRRYQARRTLVIEARCRRPRARRTRTPPIYLAVARARGRRCWRTSRASRVLLNYAGVLLYELGSLDAAEELFKAARRLDPDLPHVERNLEEIARRRRSGVDVPRGLPAAGARRAERGSAEARRARRRQRPAGRGPDASASA